MNQIKRYDWVEDGMSLHSEGDYVFHSDHDAEVARLRAMAQEQGVRDGNEIGRLRAEVEGLRKYADRYRWLQKQTPYRFGKIQAACVIDAVDTLYFKSDEFDALIDAAMGASA